MSNTAENIEQFPTKEPSVKHKSLFVALAAAQSEMGKALKDTKNEFFKTSYADLSSVMEACLPSLNRHGIAVIQPPFNEEGERYVKTVFVHGESGEKVECNVPLIVNKNDMQGYGSAVTYARRYGLMAMAGIAPEDDDGNAAAKAAPKAPSKNDDTRALFTNFQEQMRKCQNPDDLRNFWSDTDAKAIRAKLPADWVKTLTDECAKLGNELTGKLASDETPFEGE